MQWQCKSRLTHPLLPQQCRRLFRHPRRLFRHPSVPLIPYLHDNPVAAGNLLTAQAYNQRAPVVSPCRILPHVDIAQEVIAEHTRDEHQPLHVDAATLEQVIERLPLAIDAPRKLPIRHTALVKPSPDKTAYMNFRCHCWETLTPTPPPCGLAVLQRRRRGKLALIPRPGLRTAHLQG